MFKKNHLKLFTFLLIKNRLTNLLKLYLNKSLNTLNYY